MPLPHEFNIEQTHDIFFGISNPNGLYFSATVATMDEKGPSTPGKELTLRDLLFQAATEQDGDKLRKLLDEITARLARGERIVQVD